MKRLIASVTTLSLLLAACSHSDNGENKKKDDSSKTEQKENKATHNSTDKSKNQKGNDSRSNNNKSEQPSKQSKNDNQSQSSDQSQSNTTQEKSQNTEYVEPYQNSQSTQVARSLSPFDGDKNQALQQLPNFETALNIARSEANMFGNSNKKYNDYSIESSNDGYRYVFSFKDSSKDNTYSIVTVNRQGQPTIIDPNYHQ